MKKITVTQPQSIKFKFWDSINRFWCDSLDYFVNCNGVSIYVGSVDDEPKPEKWVIPVQSVDLKDNDKNDIYYGDIYRVYGYGDLVIKNIHDVMTVIDAMGEGDLGDKLGDIYNNPELKDAE